ncbi:ATP-binding protein [Lysobacter sp. A03]|uniref:ATP-binding protein n=1 Tax=Lysobacter sp. A03 TaxID=1199154 RepID=UPI0006968989|nr:ATP-binding protein [Lysobacter sp. A03]
MRDIGYSFDSALADILDNSVSARARKVEILNGLDDRDKPYVAIVDDGHGMNSDELTGAMRHGSRSPLATRTEGDLGRFGLGLKTASFSQCRRLTVVSRKGGETHGRRWDLDRVVETDEWLLRRLDIHEIGDLPCIDFLPATGTLVLWQALDRLDAEDLSPGKLSEALNELFAGARRHLALTFHRYIRPEPSDSDLLPVEISINGFPIEAADPFALHMSPTSDSHEIACLTAGDSQITAQAFTLPHHSRLTPTQLENLALGTSLAEAQGLYIYRAKRLINGGTWLGLCKRSEMSKLLRVRVDVPTSLDAFWGVDVRKSRIRPPAAVRSRLRPLVERMTQSAKRPYTYRGRRQVQEATLPMWDRVEERGHIRYLINRAHPLIEGFKLVDEDFSRIESILAVIEASLPLEAMFSDVGSHPQNVRQSDFDEAQLEQLLLTYVGIMAPNSDRLPAAVYKQIKSAAPFKDDSRVHRILEKHRMIEDQ